MEMVPVLSIEQDGEQVRITVTSSGTKWEIICESITAAAKVAVDAELMFLAQARHVVEDGTGFLGAALTYEPHKLREVGFAEVE